MTTTADRLVLLVDSSTLPLLERAARLAAMVHAELDAVFIEDDDLLRIASLPFSREVVLHTGAVRKLSRERLQQETNREFERFRKSLAQTATRFRIQWGCRRYTGSRREFWRETGQATLLFAGGLHAIRPAPVRSRLKEMVYAVYNGTDSARNALKVALNVAEADGQHLVVLIPETPDYATLYEQARALVEGARTSTQLVPVHHPDSMPNLKVMVAGLRGSLLFLPRELEILDSNDFDELLQVVRLPVILVH